MPAAVPTAPPAAPAVPAGPLPPRPGFRKVYISGIRGAPIIQVADTFETAFGTRAALPYFPDRYIKDLWIVNIPGQPRRDPLDNLPITPSKKKIA